MQIQKRSFPVYVLLNILTLGIYGMVVSNQINNEINAICKGDKEQPKGYAVAFVIRAIAPFTGLFIGFILGLIGAVSDVSVLNSILGGAMVGDYSYLYALTSSTDFAAVLLVAAICCVLFTAVGVVISGIYYNFWWYKQTNRLKLNAGRYGLDVKEGGIDTFILRTAGEALFIPVSVICVCLSLVAPLLLIWILSYIESPMTMIVLMSMVVFAVCAILCVFGGELTTGAQFSMYFVFKNLSRFADVYRNGAEPFDPMAYEYYPSVESHYPNFVPNLVNGEGAVVSGGNAGKDAKTGDEGNNGGNFTNGKLIGEKGSCAGYVFDMVSGEEIIIGKDAKVSMVVIDAAYKEISRKHVGVCYDVIYNNYRVVDYSSNGTWANGTKLTPGQAVYLPCGTELKLANDKNIFRLG